MEQARISHYPLAHLSLKLSVQGLFALPADWQTLEETNPNFFIYDFSMPQLCQTTGRYQAKKPSL